MAVVNSTNLIKILMTHPKMKALSAEATTDYVQRKTGEAGGIARAMEAATAPTEGQRMLQAGFDGAIIQGESRKQFSQSTDAASNVLTERLVERTFTLPDGQTVVLQQAQHVVQAVPFDQGSNIEVMTTACNTGNNSVMTHSTKLNKTTMSAGSVEVRSTRRRATYEYTYI